MGWLAGYSLEPPLLLGLATFGLLPSLSEGSLGVGLITASVFLAPVVPSIASMTELDVDELRTGFRLRPRRVPRAAVVRSRLDDVPWGRGGPVPGVVLDLVDGTVEPIRMSALSRPRTRARWADTIDAWADAYDTPLDLNEQPIILRLPKKTAALGDDMLAARPPGVAGILVAAIGFPRDYDEYRRRDVVVRSSLDEVSVHLRRPVEWLPLHHGDHHATISWRPDEPTTRIDLPSEPGATYLLTIGPRHRQAFRWELSLIDGDAVPAPARVHRPTEPR